MQFLLCLNFVSLFWTEHRIEGVLFLIEEDFGKVLLGVVHLLRGPWVALSNLQSLCSLVSSREYSWSKPGPCEDDASRENGEK